MPSNRSQTASPSQYSSNASELETDSIATRNSKINSVRYRPSPTNKKKKGYDLSDSEGSELTILDSESDDEKISQLSDNDGKDTPNQNINFEGLTRRQKAKYLEDYQVEFLELPTESKKSKLTPEEIESRRAELSRRRRHQSQQRAEEEKNAVISRLLKKQATKKSTKRDNKEISQEAEDYARSPTNILYKNYNNGLALLSFPNSVQIGLDLSKPKNRTAKQLKCQAPGCKLPKKYCDPKNNKLSCSLNHYKLLLNKK